jgi:hypothetical protein
MPPPTKTSALPPIVATAGEVLLGVASRAVHWAVSEEAVVVLIAVSGETPEWPGSARNIGQSKAAMLRGGRLVPGAERASPGARDGLAVGAARAT